MLAQTIVNPTKQSVKYHVQGIEYEYKVTITVL